MIIYDNWQDAVDNWPEEWGEFFSPHELRCRGTGTLRINEGFMAKLIDLRIECDFSFPVTSAGRDPVYNDNISKSGLNGPHTFGAIDLGLSGKKALICLNRAIAVGMTGIGINQRGPYDERFIHLDDLEDDYDGEGAPRPHIWSY